MPAHLTPERASTDTHYAGERGGKEEKRGAGGGGEEEKQVEVMGMKQLGHGATASAECSSLSPKPQQNAKEFPSIGFA
jgi:hypothetical protein